MSKRAERLVAEIRPDMVLQSGCYFGLSNPKVPYVLNLVHTHALSQARASLSGVSLPPRTAASWLTLERSTYHRAHRIVAMSNFVRASLIHDYGVSESKICVVGSGPILHTYPDIVQHQDDGRTVLFVGLRFENKGGPTLLRAMERVRKSVPDARLLVAGVSRPSTDSVRYLGRVPKDEIGNYYTKATVFALPTLSESSYPLVFLEAMAYGLPCIGSDIEAIPEIIADGETGFIVPPANDEALAERLIQLLKDPELRRRMGNAGRARQERLYTWEKVAYAIEASR